MPAKMFSVPVTLYANLMVKADSEDAAAEIAKRYRNQHIELPEDGPHVGLPVSGVLFDVDALPPVSLSSGVQIAEIEATWIEQITDAD